MRPTAQGGDTEANGTMPRCCEDHHPTGTQSPQATAGATAGTTWPATQAHLGPEPLRAQIWDPEATVLANTISSALGKVFRASLFILV